MICQLTNCAAPCVTYILPVLVGGVLLRALARRYKYMYEGSGGEKWKMKELSGERETEPVHHDAEETKSRSLIRSFGAWRGAVACLLPASLGTARSTT